MQAGKDIVGLEVTPRREPVVAAGGAPGFVRIDPLPRALDPASVLQSSERRIQGAGLQASGFGDFESVVVSCRIRKELCKQEAGLTGNSERRRHIYDDSPPTLGGRQARTGRSTWVDLMPGMRI